MFRFQKSLSFSANEALSCFNRPRINVNNNCSLKPMPTVCSLKLHGFISQEILSRPFSSQEDIENRLLGKSVIVESQKYDKSNDESKSSVPVIILHGLLGSKQNWNSMAAQLNRKIGRTVWTLDARNHGDSPHTELFTYELMVIDVIMFMQRKGIPKATIIGHSLGGRTAMMLSMMYPSLVQSLVVVDISPRGASPNMKGIKQLLNDLNNLSLGPELTAREARIEAAILLKEKVKDERIIAFVLTNLVDNTDKRGKSNWRWKFNLDSIIKNVEKEIFEFPIIKHPCSVRTLFLGGAESDYINPADEKAIKMLFPEAEFTYIQGAGHWVHAEKPAEFLDIVTEFINKDPKV